MTFQEAWQTIQPDTYDPYEQAKYWWGVALEEAAKLACPYGEHVTPWEDGEISASRIIAAAILKLKETP